MARAVRRSASSESFPPGVSWTPKIRSPSLRAIFTSWETSLSTDFAVIFPSTVRKPS